MVCGSPGPWRGLHGGGRGPLGFTHAAFAAFGGAPVDDTRPAPRYPDGHNWDTSVFRLPREARSVKATLCYQTTSKEYVEFLRDANTTNDAGQRLYDLWTANDRATPVVMATDSMSFEPPPIPLPTVLALRPLANPAPRRR